MYNEVTSIETRMVPEERGFMDSNFEDNQWCLSNVRATLLYEVEGGNRRIRRFFLFSIDVTSLCTKIPPNDGIEACRDAWDKRSVKEPPTECLVQLLTLVLKHNNFTFNGEHYQRNRYGNIFMGKLEKLIIQSPPCKPVS